MFISKTKRAINFLIFAAAIGFINHFSGPAFDQVDRASKAIESIQARAQ